MPLRWSRRELLGAFLGAPLASLACSRVRPRQYPGVLVGADAAAGHLLRGPRTAALGAAVAQRVGVLVVGAGPAGLSAAWWLRRSGVNDIAVLELEPEAGGSSRGGRNAVSAFPWGAHYVPAPTRDNPLLIALLREMGLLEGDDAQGEPVVAEQAMVRDLDERVYSRGRWSEGLYEGAGESADEARQRVAFHAAIERWVAYRDARGRRAFALPAALGSDSDEVRALDRSSMAEWMQSQGFTSPKLLWLVDYACRDDYGMRARDTSAWAGLFYFCSRQRAPGEAARELIAHPDGNGALVAHLARAVEPSRVQTGVVVLSVQPTEDGRVRVEGVEARSGRAVAYSAEQAVLAVPQFVARRLVAAPGEPSPSWLRELSYAPWLVANLTLRGRPREREGEPGMAWDNVLRASPSLGYVCATHQSLRDHGPTVLTWYYALCDEDPAQGRRRLLDTSREHWVDVCVSDLSLAHPDLGALIERVDVCKWGHAMVRPTRGLVFGEALASAREPVAGRVFFAHSDLSGVALFEEAQYRGVEAARAVLRARTTPEITLFQGDALAKRALT